jgi:hypothetical protein
LLTTGDISGERGEKRRKKNIEWENFSTSNGEMQNESFSLGQGIFAKFSRKTGCA